MIVFSYVWQVFTLAFGAFCLVWATLLFLEGETLAGVIFLINTASMAVLCLTGYFWRLTARAWRS